MKQSPFEVCSLICSQDIPQSGKSVILFHGWAGEALRNPVAASRTHKLKSRQDLDSDVLTLVLRCPQLPAQSQFKHKDQRSWVFCNNPHWKILPYCVWIWDCKENDHYIYIAYPKILHTDLNKTWQTNICRQKATLNKSELLSCVHSLRHHGLYSPWNSPDQNTGVGSLSLLQGIFPTQGSNPGLLHCRRILYQLSYQRSSAIPNRQG